MAKGNRKNAKTSVNLPEVEDINDVTTATEQSVDLTTDEATQYLTSDIASDHLENDFDEIDSELQESAEEAKPRKTRGKRQAYYDCAANVTLAADIPERDLKSGSVALVLEAIAVTMPLDDEGEFDRNKTRIEAIDNFKNKYGVEPELINGPVYNMKGLTSLPRKRETINVTIALDAPFTTERGKAVHRFNNLDWNVLVNFTERKDTVYVFYENLVDPKLAQKNKNKLQKPSAKFLPVAALRELRHISA